MGLARTVLDGAHRAPAGGADLGGSSLGRSWSTEEGAPRCVAKVCHAVILPVTHWGGLPC